MDIIKLPSPQKDLAFPLMKAIEKRRTKRKWDLSAVQMQDLSNILWVACGITAVRTNRNKEKRAAPSATNCQEIKIYVAHELGLFLYNEQRHELNKIKNEDIRYKIGTQKMMKSAPIGLIYVSDYSKMKTYLSKDENTKWFVSGTDTGFMSQNVYLYCSAAQLSTCVIGLVDRHDLEKSMGLEKFERVVYTQAIGNAIPE